MDAPSVTPKNSAADRPGIQIFGILVIAFVLRITGASFGLPFLYHADEPIIVNHALAYASGDFNPHFFRIPPLISYLLFGWYGIAFVFGKWIGIFSGPAAFEALFLQDPTFFYLSGRVIFGVCLGVLTVYFYYSLLKKISNGIVAVAAALLLAVNPLLVRESHYLYVDVPLLLVMVLFFRSLLTGDEAAPGRISFHLKLGFWIGLATAVKYNGCFLFIPYLYLWGMNTPRPLKLKGALACLFAVVLTYAFLNPYSLIDFKFFMQEMAKERLAHTGAGVVHHLNYSLAGALGWPLILCALGGMIYLAYRRERRYQALILFTMVYYMILVLGGQAYARYVLPLIPWLITFAVELISRFAVKVWPRQAKTLTVVWILLIALPATLSSFAIGYLASTEDTRSTARRWILANIPAGSMIALDHDFFCPRLEFTRSQIEDKIRALDQNGAFSGIRAKRLRYLLDQANRNLPDYQLFFLNRQPDDLNRPLLSSPSLPFDVEDLKRRGIQYVVTSLKANGPSSFYQTLSREAELVGSFEAYRKPLNGDADLMDPFAITGLPLLSHDLIARKAAGPPIRIYRLKR